MDKVHGIFQARILEWVAVPFSRRSSWLKDQTQVSHIAGGFFTSWVTREAHIQVEDNHKLDICSEYGKMWTEESADTYRAQLDGTSCIYEADWKDFFLPKSHLNKSVIESLQVC